MTLTNDFLGSLGISTARCHISHFGLSSSCCCFTKPFAPLIKRWRSMSHNCFLYLDDGITSHRDCVSACVASAIQASFLMKTNTIES